MTTAQTALIVYHLLPLALKEAVFARCLSHHGFQHPVLYEKALHLCARTRRRSLRIVLLLLLLT